MEYKKIMFMLVLAVFLLSITCVSASEIDDTLASEDTNTIGLSVDNDIIEDNLQTSEENDELALTDNDETLSAKNDTDVLSDNSGTYSGLSAEIGFGGNIELQHDYYTYDTGNTISISVADSVIDGKGATINMTGSNIRAFTVSASGVTIKNLTIINANYDDHGGAIYFSSSGTVSNCNFADNKATGDYSYGGAVYFLNVGEVSNCNFAGNTATHYGGAVYFSNTSSVSNCNFTANTANEYGGAVYFSSSGTVTNCNFADNSANRGGAIFSWNWYTAADTCIFKRNSGENVNVVIYPPTLNVDNFTTFYGSGEKLTFNLTTDSGMSVTNGNISISVYVKDNNSWVGNYSCLSGEGWTVSLPVGSYYANFTTEYAEFQTISRTITISKAKTELTAKAITAAYNTNKKMVITLKDVNGKPLSGLKLTVKIKSDKTYTTDKNGQVKISVGKLTPKTYNVKITFGENANYLPSSANVKVTVKKAKSKITAKKKTIKKAKKYTVTLKSGKKPIKKAKVILKIKKKTFKAKTNKKGKATFKIKKLKKGKYTTKVTFKGNKYYKKSTKKVKIIVK